MRTLTRCKGWMSGGCQATSEGGIVVNIRGVCACKQHKKCASSKRCEMLFTSGGTIACNQTLARLMKVEGKVMPRSWKDCWIYIEQSLKTYLAKENAIEGYERQYFKACKPVVVEIKRR